MEFEFYKQRKVSKQDFQQHIQYINNYREQESPAVADKPARRESMPNRAATRWWRNHAATFLRFDTIPARDGQTDRHVVIAITHASIASRR